MKTDHGPTAGARWDRLLEMRSRLRGVPVGCVLLLSVIALLAPPAAQAAGPPLVTATSFSEVTQTSATISATVDPTGGSTKAHFELTTLADFKDHEFQFATRLPAQASEDFAVPTGAPKTISTPLSGLSPATGYVFRAVAKKVSGGLEGEGTATTFYTYGPPPVFAPCPNDEYRSGGRAVPGAPGAALPDCRSYEMASPLDKNGNGVRSSKGFTRAAVDGSAVTFGVPFGIPGGKGAQMVPYYQGSRGATDWTTAGLLAPASLGEASHYLVGQLPDLSATYATVSRYDPPVRSSLFELHRDGSAPTQITPFAPGIAEADADATNLGFAGASADASTVVVQARVPLSSEDLGPPIPGSTTDGPNVYAWDRATGRLHLASTMNSLEQTEGKLPKGAWAGPYNWTRDILDKEGGSEGGYYLTDEHVVSENGSVFFTSRSDGHLYERINPTQLQSAVIHAGEEDEECTEPAKACTIDVSGSRRPEPDPGGPQPAAFQMATADGSKVIFTSSEKLTADANTGPEQPPAQIGRATLNGDGAADPVKEDFLPAHALGIAVDPKGEHIYWAEPLKGTIGRANLNGEGDPVNPEPEFIVPGNTQAETHQTSEPGVITSVPSKPRYVAVGPCAGGAECVYWSNAGPPGEDNFGNEFTTIDGQGTLGRAKLKPDSSGTEGEIEPEFIAGASNPQGIAVNATHIYWANAANFKGNNAIGRAELDGSAADQAFATPFGEWTPYGVALSATDVYFSLNGNHGELERVPLEGGPGEGPFIGEAGLRGIAVDSGYLYWVTQGEGGAIGRLPLAEFSGSCNSKPSCDKHFLTPAGTSEGLAVSGSHLFWSANGEAPGNPGKDLYRFEPGTKTLTDLTPKDSNESPNGAEVRGVLGTSVDGSYVYFVANGDLDGPEGEAEAGDCKGKTFNEVQGECNIYLYHDGEYRFVARVSTSSQSKGSSDVVDWLPQPWASQLISLKPTPKSSWVSSDGRTLVFRSIRRLTAYDNDGQMELYRFALGEGVDCLTCTPSGEAPIAFPNYINYFLEGLKFPSINPAPGMSLQVQPRLASADGTRVFFETPESLVADDTDGGSACRLKEETLSCLDVYEWEAPGIGTCTADGPAYSPLNEGCLYLISPNSDSEPAFFADASSSGDDVFIFTPAQLVGRDGDELLDVYDARVDGGLASQNPLPAPPCESEGCKPAASQPPQFQSPPQFSGPANPQPPKACPRGKVRKNGKCVKKAKKHRKKSHKHHGAKRGAGR